MCPLCPLPPCQGAAYGGTYSLVHEDLKQLGITASMIDISEPCDTWDSLVTPHTKVGSSHRDLQL